MKILIETSGGGGVVLLVVVALLAGGHGDGIGTAVIAVLVALAIVVALALAAGLIILGRRHEYRAVSYHAEQVPESRQVIAGPATASLEAPAPQVVNLHFHGVDEDRVAEILRRNAQDN